MRSASHPRPNADRGRRAPGFTIVEMLVVIGIIALLMGLLLPALSGVRATGRRTGELMAARQLMTAYINYATVNNDAVLPGYKTGLRATDWTGRPIDDITIPFVSARYPWRLAPFMDYQFRGLYLNEHEETLESMEHAPDYETYIYLISLYPSLGLNATWMGGHQGRLGFDATALRAFGRFYVTRLAEVRRADQLIVFCSARGSDPYASDTVYEGYFEVRSPRFTESGGDAWGDWYRDSDEPGAWGFVSPRHQDEAVVSFVDGHVDGLSIEQLKDMRYWARDADRPDWSLEVMGTN